MAKKKQEVQQKNEGELKALVKELRGKLRGLRLDFSTGKLKSTTSLTTTRKEIARALTALKGKSVKKEVTK